MDSTFLFKVIVYVNVVHISYQKGEKKGGMVKREKGRGGEKREGKAGRQERTILLMLRGDRPLITSHLPPTTGDLPQVTYHWWPASPHHRITWGTYYSDSQSLPLEPLSDSKVQIRGLQSVIFSSTRSTIIKLEPAPESLGGLVKTQGTLPVSF